MSSVTGKFFTYLYKYLAHIRWRLESNLFKNVPGFAGNRTRVTPHNIPVPNQLNYRGGNGLDFNDY